MKNWMIMATAVMMAVPVCVTAGQELPDELTLNVGTVNKQRQTGGGGQAITVLATNVTVVLRKHSVRSDDYLCGIWTDKGFKKIIFPVSTYRGYVQNDPTMYVNGNIEPGGILNLNFTRNRLILARIRGMKIDIPKGKCTPTMSAGHKVVPLKKLTQRQVRTPGGYVIPEVPMRMSKWWLNIPTNYTGQAGMTMETVVSQVEQRWNDGDFIFARDVGTAWEIDTLVLMDPKATTGIDKKAIRPDADERMNGQLWGGVSGVPGRNHGKINALYVTGLFHEAQILLHEGAHLYDNWCHQLDRNDGLCGGGAYWGYNNVGFLVDQRKARYNETNFPGIIYGSPLPPHATYDFANTRKDKAVTIDVLANDYDGNGDAVSVQAVVPKSEKGGTCEVSKDGKHVVYTPAPGFVGADKFTYTVVDSTGLPNCSGEVKVDVRTDGLAAYFDFENPREELLEDRRSTNPTDSTLWFDDLYDPRPVEEKRLYHFKNMGPYDGGGAFAHWIKYFPVNGVHGKGIWNPGLLRQATVHLGQVGDPGWESLSASVWVLFPPTGGGGTIICKGGAPFNFVNGWAINGSTGKSFSFSGNVAGMRAKEAFGLTSAEIIEPNKWYHLVMVMDRQKKQLRAWINNVEVKAGEKDNTKIPDGVIEYYGDLHLFNRYTGKWWSGAKGLVDDVKIFTSVLNDKQVAELYAEGKDAKVPEI